jgi:hypothetical protein
MVGAPVSAPFPEWNKRMAVSCPKCASQDGVKLPLAHRHGLMDPHPPDTREVKFWILVAFGSVVGLADVNPQISLPGLALLSLLIVAGVMAYRAQIYNLRRLPSLKQQWENSTMCSRCGHVFTA